MFDDWYSSYTPVYYTYIPTVYYYLCEWWWFPTACNKTYIVWRQNLLNKNTKDTGKTLKLRKEKSTLLKPASKLSSLKNKSSEKKTFHLLKLEKIKAYDPRWLLAQLKISRLLFLEDEINKNKKVIIENDVTSFPSEAKKEENRDDRKDSIKIEKIDN